MKNYLNLIITRYLFHSLSTTLTQLSKRIRKKLNTAWLKIGGKKLTRNSKNTNLKKMPKEMKYNSE